MCTKLTLEIWSHTVDRVDVFGPGLLLNKLSEKDQQYDFDQHIWSILCTKQATLPKYEITCQYTTSYEVPRSRLL